MTPRERNMVIGLLAAILIGLGVFGGYTLVYSPLEDANASIKQLDEEIRGDGTVDKPGLFDKVDTMRKSATQAALVKRASLPPNIDLAKTQYKLLLERLLQQARIEQYQIPPNNTALDSRPPLTPELGNKKPAFTRLGFQVNMNKVDIWQVADFLYEFYQLDLLHQITDISITRENKPNEVRSGLEVKLKIEAIILDGAEQKPSLFPVSLDNKLTSSGEAVAAIGGGRAVLAVAAHPELSRKVTAGTNLQVLAAKPRDYSLLALKDIFYGILPDKAPPALNIAKISDILVKPGDKIPDVKVSLSGEGAENARIAAKCFGSMLPEGALEIDPDTNAIKFPAMNEDLSDYAFSTITVTAVSEFGKEAKSTFNLKIIKPMGTVLIKDDIASEIRLVMVGASSDGSMCALIQDNATPLKYKITSKATTGIEVVKWWLVKPAKHEWWKDRDYEHPPGILAISDEFSATKKTLKIIAIEHDSLIVMDLTKPEVKPDGNKWVGKGNRPGGGAGGGAPPSPPAMKSGPPNPLPAVAGNLALAVPASRAKLLAEIAMRFAVGNLGKSPPPPVLYRWVNGKSLKDLEQAKISPDEARKILQNVADVGDVGSPVSAAK
jgi:hypothetical protein